MIDSGDYTPEANARRAKIAEVLMLGAMQPREIRHPLQGVAQMAQALVAGRMLRGAEESERAGQAEVAENYRKILMLNGQGSQSPDTAFSSPPAAPSLFSPPPTSVQPGMITGEAPQDIQPGMRVSSAPQPGGNPNFQNAISSIESGGRYDALGPVTKTGDRAYGKYQIMGNNIGPWSQAALGQQISPQEFLSKPQLQDQIFNHRFGGYVDKYGPVDAAKAWFAGEKGMNNPNARDQLGTTVSAYADKFAGVLGAPAQQPSPIQLASLGGAQQMNDAGFGGGSMPPAQPLGPQVAQAFPGQPGSDVDPMMRMAQGGLPSRQPQAAPQPQMRFASQANPMQDMILQGLKSENPYVRRQAQAMAAKMVEGQLKPSEYKIEITPDGRVIAVNTRDPSKAQTITVPGASEAAVQYAADKTTAEAIAKRTAANGLPATSEEATALRKEVQQLPSYKNVTQAAPIYKAMLDSAGRDTRASDLNLVYGLGKIFDPGSVVREGEMVMVKNTASLPDWLVGAANSLNGGASLLPTTRAAIMKEAHSRMASYKQTFEQDIEMYRGIADRNRMLADDVIPQLGDFPEFKRAAPETAPASAPQSDKLLIENLLRKYGNGKRTND